MAKRHLITCALPYANGPLHIGHVAGCFLPSDIYFRFLKMKKEEVLYVCGTDEHGVPITLKAKAENKTPQQVVDENYTIIAQSLQDFDIHFDIFGRTSSAIHHQTASDFFKTLYDKGIFEEQTTEQFFDPEANQFLADRYIKGTCPKCGYDNAYGDQCEKCGSSLSPSELISPKSALSGAAPILKSTKNWYLPLDKIQDEFLNTWVESKKALWKSNVYGQCKSWLSEGLKPRAMTRDLDWGVKLPIPDTDTKVMYVWFDAPIGYISFTKQAAGDDWEKWWKDPETSLTHFLGKDNIVFHTIVFPAMLHTHGEFILPTNVPANEFLNLEGDKLSTSRNHAIWLHEYIAAYPNKTDELRYVLTSILPETKDSDFTWADYQSKVNNELVAIFGNFVNRVVVLTEKYFDGKIPAGVSQLDTSDLEEKINTALSTFHQRQGLEAYMEIARMGNKYLQDIAPWQLIKNPDAIEEVKNCLFTCVQIVKVLGKYGQIFLPKTSKNILKLLNINDFETILVPEAKLTNIGLLFEKIEDDFIQAQELKLKKEDMLSVETIVEAKQSKPEITYDDFAKLDLRTAVILRAQKVKKADRLLHITLDVDGEEREVVSGIAEHFSPENIIGKQVTYLYNLAPRNLKGIESKGMILMAEDKNKKLYFVAPEEIISSGSGIS